MNPALQVTVGELDMLLQMGPRPLQKDASALGTLLQRMRNTLLSAWDEVIRQRATIDLQASQLTARAGGVPTTLNPSDALRYLTDEEKESVFDSIARDRLAQLRHLVARAEKEAALVNQQLDGVRTVALWMSSCTEIPPHIRAEATRQLNLLPREAATVHHPAMIDFEDPVPAKARLALPAGRPAAPPSRQELQRPAATGHRDPQPDSASSLPQHENARPLQPSPDFPTRNGGQPPRGLQSADQPVQPDTLRDQHHPSGSPTFIDPYSTGRNTGGYSQ